MSPIRRHKLKLKDKRAEDPDMTIGEWIRFLKELALEYGDDAVLYVDAGYNNSNLVLDVEELD